MLAVTVVCQMLRPLITLPGLGSTMVIGSLVNTSLAVSSVVVGLWGGIIISIAAPIIAFMQQQPQFQRYCIRCRLCPQQSMKPEAAVKQN